METVENGFREFMKRVYPSVMDGSVTWNKLRTVWFTSALWLLSTMATARKEGTNPLPVLTKEVDDFVQLHKARRSIMDDIVKSGTNHERS